MTVNEVFGLRNQGRTEDAYEAARMIYAADKSPYASAAMFWTAVDLLRMRVTEDRMDEAQEIYTALEHLLDGMKDEKGWMHNAMKNCQILMGKDGTRADLLDNGPEHLQTGVWGEELAVAYLREKGYIIMERDWHSKHRDIDIIAQNDEYVVFVEVKTRHNRDYGDPEDSIDYQKQYNLKLAINNYLNYQKIEKPWRFDVITIVGELGDTMPEITHIEDFMLNYR